MLASPSYLAKCFRPRPVVWTSTRDSHGSSGYVVQPFIDLKWSIAFIAPGRAWSHSNGLGRSVSEQK